METKHTPGPWSVAYVDSNGQSVVKSEHIEIATCWHHSVASIEEEMQANAILIAAAPELLDEARAFNAVVVTHECPSCGIAWSENECSQMLDEKSASCLCGYRHNFDGAVIAKAEGR